MDMLANPDKRPEGTSVTIDWSPKKVQKHNMATVAGTKEAEQSLDIATHVLYPLAREVTLEQHYKTKVRCDR